MLPFSFLWLPALSQLTFKGRVYSWPSLWALGSPSTVWAHFSRALVKALGRLCTLKFLSQSVLAGFAMWASLQDGLAAWLLAQSGSAAALSLSPCLAAAPGSQGFVSAFPFLPAGLAMQSGSQEQDQDLVYRCKGWRKPHPLLALTTSGEINTPTVLLRQFRELYYFLKIYFYAQGTDF